MAAHVTQGLDSLRFDCSARARATHWTPRYRLSLSKLYRFSRELEGQCQRASEAELVQQGWNRPALSQLAERAARARRILILKQTLNAAATGLKPDNDSEGTPARAGPPYISPLLVENKAAGARGCF